MQVSEAVCHCTGHINRNTCNYDVVSILAKDRKFIGGDFSSACLAVALPYIVNLFVL